MPSIRYACILSRFRKVSGLIGFGLRGCWRCIGQRSVVEGLFGVFATENKDHFFVKNLNPSCISLFNRISLSCKKHAKCILKPLQTELVVAVVPLKEKDDNNGMHLDLKINISNTSLVEAPFPDLFEKGAF